MVASHDIVQKIYVKLGRSQTQTFYICTAITAELQQELPVVTAMRYVNTASFYIPDRSTA